MQPKNESQAIAWVKYLEKNNYNFDVGISQVNIKNIHNYGYTASDMLDPCLNLKIASEIFAKSHDLALSSSNNANALQQAISAYNTGNFSSGFKNGYVAKVTKNLDTKLVLNDDIPPIVTVMPVKDFKKTVTTQITKSNDSISSNHDADKPNPYTAKSVLYIAPPRKATPEELANAQYL